MLSGKPALKFPWELRDRLSTVKCSSIKDPSDKSRDVILCNINLVEEDQWDDVKKGLKRGSVSKVENFAIEVDLEDKDHSGNFHSYDVTVKHLCDRDNVDCIGIGSDQGHLLEQIMRKLDELPGVVVPSLASSPPQSVKRPPAFRPPPVSGVHEKLPKPTDVLNEVVTQLNIIAPSRTRKTAGECAALGNEFKVRPERADFPDDKSFDDAVKRYDVTRKYRAVWVESPPAFSCIVSGLDSVGDCKNLSVNPEFYEYGVKVADVDGNPACVASMVGSSAECRELATTLANDVVFSSLSTVEFERPAVSRCVPVHERDGLDAILPYEDLCKRLRNDTTVKQLSTAYGWDLEWDGQNDTCVTVKGRREGE